MPNLVEGSPVTEGIVVATPADQDTTDDYVDVEGSLLDTAKSGARYISYLVAEVGGDNGITFKIMASIDGETYTLINGPLNQAGSEDADGIIAVNANASTEVFVTPDYDSGAKACYRFYKVQVKSTMMAMAGTVRVRGFAK